MTMNHTYANALTPAAQAAPKDLVQLTRKRGMSDVAFAEMMKQLGRRRAGLIAAGEGPGLDAEMVDEGLVSAAAAGLPDCLTCGACCAYFHQIAVLDRDPTPRRLAWTVWDAEDIAGPKVHWLKREPGEGRCIAFAGSVGQRAACTIYEVRPYSCRAFAAGSDRCRAVRRVYGLDPPLSELERIEHGKRIQADADGEMEAVEGLANRHAASFGEREKAGLLGEMIDYHRSRLAEIFSEAQRLQTLLTEKGSATAAASGLCRVQAINEETQTLTSAWQRLPVIECAELLNETEIEKINRDLLEVAAQSQAALARASRWLAALGEEVFAALAMRVELA
jgi:Fe-S-cluster containining protein